MIRILLAVILFVMGMILNPKMVLFLNFVTIPKHENFFNHNGIGVFSISWIKTLSGNVV